MKPGATGKFPEGMLRPDDEGQLITAVSIEHGKIVIDFGKKIAWVSMRPEVAIEFAEAIIKKAKQI